MLDRYLLKLPWPLSRLVGAHMTAKHARQRGWPVDWWDLLVEAVFGVGVTVTDTASGPPIMPLHRLIRWAYRDGDESGKRSE